MTPARRGIRIRSLLFKEQSMGVTTGRAEELTEPKSSAYLTFRRSSSGHRDVNLERMFKEIASV